MRRAACARSTMPSPVRAISSRMRRAGFMVMAGSQRNIHSAEAMNHERLDLLARATRVLTFRATMTSPAGAAGAPEGRESLQDAYRLCETIAREHYENFPVASRFLSATARPALSAVYAFPRQADDFADEGYGPGGPSRDVC